MSNAVSSSRVIPGLRLTLATTILYLSILVLLPISAVFLKSASLNITQWLALLSDPRVISALTLSFSASLYAALINFVFGSVIAWVLVRYEIPFKKMWDALIDLPFALPTAVAGIALSAIYANNGALGQFLSPLGIEISYTKLGILLALVFIGTPFVVRTVQPVLEEQDAQQEEAANCLGATRWQTFFHVILPALKPALLTGFALAFARAVGEFGSVIFIAGNLPLQTEIAPLLIYIKLEQYDYAGATAIASVMLLFSFIMLLIINSLQKAQSS
jgi:sulfate transport system permease protein